MHSGCLSLRLAFSQNKSGSASWRKRPATAQTPWAIEILHEPQMDSSWAANQVILSPGSVKVKISWATWKVRQTALLLVCGYIQPETSFMICNTDGISARIACADLGSAAVVSQRAIKSDGDALPMSQRPYMWACELPEKKRPASASGRNAQKRRLRIINKNVAKANGQGWDWVVNGQRVEHRWVGLRCLEYKQHGQQEATLLLAVFVWRPESTHTKHTVVQCVFAEAEAPKSCTSWQVGPAGTGMYDGWNHQLVQYSVYSVYLYVFVWFTSLWQVGLPVLKSERRPLKLGMNSLETFTHIVTSYNEQVALEAVKQAFQLPGEAWEVETHETARATDYINYTWWKLARV